MTVTQAENVTTAPAALLAEGISKSYGRRRVLRDVSLAAPAGALVGIVGENGAGKSTLLRILAGELRPSAGSVELRGALGYCPQAAVLNEQLNVAQHLEYFRAAYRAPDLRRADELVERLGYAKYRQTPVSALSGGSKQKLNLTIALMHRPTVLLLDEPYQGFDQGSYLDFWRQVRAWRDAGRAVVVVTHLLHELQHVDHVLDLGGAA